MFRGETGQKIPRFRLPFVGPFEVAFEGDNAFESGSIDSENSLDGSEGCEALSRWSVLIGNFVLFRVSTNDGPHAGKGAAPTSRTYWNRLAKNCPHWSLNESLNRKPRPLYWRDRQSRRIRCQ